MMDRDEEKLTQMVNQVKDTIKTAGFRDWHFVGLDMFGHRISTSSIGQDGAKFEWDNCERLDRIIGAMTRQIVSWQADITIGEARDDEGEAHAAS